MGKYPQAIENTQRIADMCSVEFEFGKYHLPLFQLPEGWTDGDAYFEKLCLDGFAWRYPERLRRINSLFTCFWALMPWSWSSR